MQRSPGLASPAPGRARRLYRPDLHAPRSDGRLPCFGCWYHDPADILETISARHGNVSMTQLGRMTGWSTRHLRRTFHDSIGVGPKTFCRIIRFMNAFRVLRRNPRPSFLDVALAAGYYDQAHFIHEFEDFYGSSPSTIFENSAF